MSCRAGSFILRKYDPAREALKLGVIRTQECGVVTKQMQQGLPSKAFRDPKLPRIRHSAKMSLEQLILALFIYGAIMATAVLAFIKEIGWR